MSKPTNIELKDYCKAVELCAENRGYGYVKHGPKKGSVYSFEIFEDKDAVAPAIIWHIHTAHSKKREIYVDDLKKAWERTAIPREDFISTLRSIKKKYQNLK
ncbi:MAG: hypothetical protein H8D63_00145 [Parcubacteria group bacterium]|nr:hypothetical protein [Parcubacteria group bacterium]